MPKILGCSVAVVEHVLPLCDFTSSRPYLRNIYNEYKRKGIEFPLFLFECIKSTPGLVGLWAHRIKEDNAFFDQNIYEFRNIPWVNYLSYHREALWKFLENYLEILELNKFDEKFHRIADLIVDNQLGVLKNRTDSSDDSVEVNPFCFAYLVGMISESKLSMKVNSALKCCEQRVDGEKYSGEPFVDYMIRCLKIRLLIRKLNQSIPSVLVSCQDFFPGNNYSGTYEVLQ